MRPIDADELIQKYINKKEEVKGNKNAEVLIKILVDTVSNAPTMDIEPYYQEVGYVDSYSNGMVALRKETFDEYSKIVEETLPKRYTESFSIKDYLNTLDKIQKDKKLYKKLFPKGITNEEKIKVVKEWKKQSENSLNSKI